ncbi:MAG: 50S ribosomal protein L1 [Bdellovibrio sp.]|nr:50S ribosomal protein L1 [Bdellovibrio sp.]
MKKRSKKYLAAMAKIDRTKFYSIEEAVKLVKEANFAKFDETIDISFRLGIDPRHADQMVRGALSLPAGTGKSVRIAVITAGEKLKEAETAGADVFGSDDLIAKIAGGWMEFDKVIASPDMMGKLGKIGRVLGPRGLMPNPKLGTVTTEIGKAVAEQKSGKVEYRTEKSGIVQVVIGKKSFTVDQIKQNFLAVVTAIMRAKPSSAKGTYLKSLTVSTSMGPGIRVDVLEAATLV